MRGPSSPSRVQNTGDITMIGSPREEIIIKTANLILEVKPMEVVVDRDKTKYTAVDRKTRGT